MFGIEGPSWILIILGIVVAFNSSKIDKVVQSNRKIKELMIALLNKKMFLAAIIIFLTILGLVGAGLGRYNSKKDELIRVSRSVATYPEFKVIDNTDEIKRINEIMGKVYWQKDIEKPLDEKDYSFWIERKDDNRRFSDYDIWFDEQTIVWDPTTNKYGYITDVDEIGYLKEVLSFY